MAIANDMHLKKRKSYTTAESAGVSFYSLLFFSSLNPTCVSDRHTAILCVLVSLSPQNPTCVSDPVVVRPWPATIPFPAKERTPPMPPPPPRTMTTVPMSPASFISRRSPSTPARNTRMLFLICKFFPPEFQTYNFQSVRRQRTLPNCDHKCLPQSLVPITMQITLLLSNPVNCKPKIYLFIFLTKRVK